MIDHQGRNDKTADAAAKAAEDAEDAAIDAEALIDNDEVDGPSSTEYSVAFTPRNLAVGFAIVAGLVAFAARRRRRSRQDG